MPHLPRFSVIPNIQFLPKKIISDIATPYRILFFAHLVLGKIVLIPDKIVNDWMAYGSAQNI